LTSLNKLKIKKEQYPPGLTGNARHIILLEFKFPAIVDKVIAMKPYADNPKIRFDYEILEEFQVGLVLSGQEVKSIKTGRASIKGAYVKILGGEAYLLGATVSPYQPANMVGEYDPQRTRKLLLKRQELKYLIGKSQEQGLALVPLRLYDQKGLVKLAIAVVRGKKQFDKREVTKKREVERTLRRVK